MTETTETAPVEDVGLRLSAAQTLAAESLQEANRAASQLRTQLHALADDVRTLEELLPGKRIALARAQSEYAVMVQLLREHFSLYRDLMELSPDSSQGDDLGSIGQHAQLDPECPA